MAIADKIGPIGEDLLIETIILQPTVETTRKFNKRHYIQLQNLSIKTSYQQEWQLFKDKILSALWNLMTCQNADLDLTIAAELTLVDIENQRHADVLGLQIRNDYSAYEKK